MSESLKPQGRSKQSSEKVQAFKRRLEKETEVYHDLFRLEITNTRKNIAFSEGDENWEQVPHKHFFHTVTSDGKTQDTSSPTAGHFHKVKVNKNEAGEILSVECGPPLVMHKGNPHPYKNDSHIHEISYIESEVVKKRVRNEEAMAVMNVKNREEREIQNSTKDFVRQ